MQEREAQRQAEMRLSTQYELPENMSEMKSFAWGKFTWRDVIFAGGILLVMVVLTLPLQGLIGQIPALLIAIGLSLPGIYLALRHHLTGDMPFEQRLKISMDNWGKPDLLVWDKTIKDGLYVGSSTHDFVPAVSFVGDGVGILPGSTGGFSVLRISTDDSDFIKPTEILQIRSGFTFLLNKLNNDTNNIPIQIFLKSSRQDLSEFVKNAESDIFRIEDNDKDGTQLIKRDRARDYASYLMGIQQSDHFYYDYYLVVTYREDAEDVGNDSINSASVNREKMLNKANPFAKKQKVQENVEVELGESRAKAMAEARAEAPFGEKNTRNAMDKRLETVVQAIRASGTTHTAINAEVLTKEEVAKLFFQCYNNDDNPSLDRVIEQSVNQKDAIVSTTVRRDFPGLFQRPEEESEDRFAALQRRGTTLSRGQ